MDHVCKKGTVEGLTHPARCTLLFLQWQVETQVPQYIRTSSTSTPGFGGSFCLRENPAALPHPPGRIRGTAPCKRLTMVTSSSLPRWLLMSPLSTLEIHGLSHQPTVKGTCVHGACYRDGEEGWGAGVVKKSFSERTFHLEDYQLCSLCHPEML